MGFPFRAFFPEFLLVASTLLLGFGYGKIVAHIIISPLLYIVSAAIALWLRRPKSTRGITMMLLAILLGGVWLWWGIEWFDPDISLQEETALVGFSLVTYVIAYFAIVPHGRELPGKVLALFAYIVGAMGLQFDGGVLQKDSEFALQLYALMFAASVGIEWHSVHRKNNEG
jgi:hypothetical protein